MEYSKQDNRTLKATESRDIFYDIEDLLSQKESLEIQLAETNALIAKAKSFGISEVIEELE